MIDEKKNLSTEPETLIVIEEKDQPKAEEFIELTDEDLENVAGGIYIRNAR